MRPNHNRSTENGAESHTVGTSVPRTPGEPLALDPDRFFDPDLTVRRIARELYDETRTLPLICPHGHVDPRILAEDSPFPEPASLLIVPDHYIFRLLYARGVPRGPLGVPRAEGRAPEPDPRAFGRRSPSHYYLFRGTPTGT